MKTSESTGRGGPRREGLTAPDRKLPPRLALLMLLTRALAAWTVLAVLAVGNGALRQFVLTPLMGQSAALPASGAVLCLVILPFAWLAHPRLNLTGAADAWRVGACWLSLTLVFEFAFGRWVADRSWAELLAAYDLSGGNLWTLVVLVIGCAPYLAGRLRRAW